MKTLTSITLALALSGCSFGGAKFEPFPAPSQPPPEDYAQIRLTDFSVQGDVGDPLGIGGATGRADGCVITITGATPPRGVSIKRGECEYRLD